MRFILARAGSKLFRRTEISSSLVTWMPLSSTKVGSKAGELGESELGNGTVAGTPAVTVPLVEKPVAFTAKFVVLRLMITRNARS